MRLIFRPEDMDASVPVIFMVGEGGERAESLVSAVKKEKLRCALAVVPVEDWNRQLSPWRAPAAFRGGEDFGDGAEVFLMELLAQMPDILAAAGSGRAYLMGYSLAGLFALYAGSRSAAFEKIAALSPSVWFEGFVGYLQENPPANACAAYYLSLGRREEKSGSARLRSVGERLRQTQALLSTQTGKAVPLVMHDGGHYTDVERRMLAAIRWLAED